MVRVKMKVIVFVFLGLVCGDELILYNNSTDFYTFAIGKISDLGPGKIDAFKELCITELIKEAIDDLGKTYLFIADDYIHENLLYSLQTNFLNSYFTNPTFFNASDSESFKHLLIFRKEFRLEDVIRMNAPPQATKFFILLRNYQEVIKKFQILWNYRLVHVVAAFVENGEAHYYTYFPYRKTHCGEVGTPHLLGKCNIFTGIFSHKEKLYPDKVDNLYSCQINVTLREFLPSAFYSQSNELIGWEVDLIKELLERINGIPNYKVIDGGLKVYRRRNGYQRLIENAEIGGGLAVSLKGLMKTDFYMYGMSLCTVWVVPRKTNTIFTASFLFKVFPPSVWILILLTYFLMAITIRLFFKVNIINVLFKLLPFLFGTTTRVKRFSKVFGAFWLWFCLIMSSVYQSGYQSHSLVPRTLQMPSDTAEIMNSSLKIIGVLDVITDLLPHFKAKYNFSEKRLKKKLTYNMWINRMTVKKNSAFFGYKEVIQYHIDKTKFASEVIIPETCEIKYLVALILKKNSHLTRKIAHICDRLAENGILEFCIRKQLSKGSPKHVPQKLVAILKPNEAHENDKLPPPINLEKLTIVFLCLITGNLLAFTVFLLEITCHWKGWNEIEKKITKKTRFWEKKVGSIKKINYLN